MSLLGQYKYIMDKNHPRANADGAVYEHVIVAEEKLGRRLFPEEIVHHKDLNELNNEPNNIMVFATKSDHARFHRCGCNEDNLSLNPNGAYTCKGKEWLCIDCGVKVSKMATRCKECAIKTKKDAKANRLRKVDRPLANDLFNELLELSGNFTAIAKKYNVSDNAVRKWCDSYGIPRKSQDYKKLKSS